MWCVWIIEEPQSDEYPRGESIDGIFAYSNDFGPKCNRQFYIVSIHEIAKITQNLTTPYSDPRVGIDYPLSIYAEKRIGQGVGIHIGFDIVAAVRGGQADLSVDFEKKHIKYAYEDN